jgi:hypothetical protein
MKPMSLNEVVQALDEGRLTEITSANYCALMQNGTPAKVGCTPSPAASITMVKEA